ncbi:MAG: ThuA domain-containing protein [Bacteroidaceae bacterium]|nr:ThuA domain-containing protein [Bacteroidaceae bacterium]
MKPFLLLFLLPIFAFAQQPRQVLVLAERGGLHEGFTSAGLQWLEGQQDSLNFRLTVLSSAQHIQKGELLKYRLILMLNHPPYAWSPDAKNDMQRYIDRGKGGFIGFHHASLLGEFDGFPMWNWFSDFLGKIRYRNYIAEKADGTVQVEDTTHPVMQGAPATFVVAEDEWYIYDTNPRPNVHVLAHVDECSYTIPTDIKMGDHPVIWTNPHKKARNVYFQFGHSRSLFDNPAFLTLFRNAIRWTLNDK